MRVCVCVCVCVCYLECLWGQYRVISMTMEQTDTVAAIPKLRPKATKLMVVECDHSYEMLYAFMYTYSECFLLKGHP
jgi:TRAP-type C4-dicarboxylate transport system permease small subunit